MLLVGPPAPQLQAQSTAPFAPGERWSVRPPSSATWIPRDATFTAQGELVWAAASGVRPEVFLSSVAPVSDPLLLRDTDFDGAVGAVSVAAGPRPDQLYSLHQLSRPDSTLRQTLVRRYDAESAALGNGFLPLWTHDMGAAVNAPAFLAIDRAGTVLIAATYDSSRSEVQLDRLDPLSGALLGRVHLDGTALRRLLLSADGKRIALAAGSTLWVLDDDDTVLLEVELPTSTAAVAFSRDGRTLAYGMGRSVLVREDAGTGFGAPSTIDGRIDDIATEVRLSDDGATLAIGWWNTFVQSEAELEVVSLPTNTRLNSVRQTGGTPGLQNFPVTLDMTPDGRRILFGLWGSGDSSSEILLVERGQPGSILSVDLPGSPYDLVLGPAGNRFISASKDLHANLFATSGVLQLFETGERDLVMMDIPKPGHALRFLVQLSEPAMTWVLVGFAGANPLEFPRLFEGVFQLDPARTILPLITVPIGANQVQASVQVPDGSIMIGLELAAQAWITTPTGPKLSGTVVRPVVL
ncbi:MAG: hypothetical protein CMJ89_06900 [Planctomycetes bacterium]|nr:hypothetical protein [Planctomycetota bacterium]